MTDDAMMRSDLGRLRTFIHQGKLRKIQNLLKNQSNRLHYLLEHEFDACAYATKFKQEHLLSILYEYGGYFIHMKSYLISLFLFRLRFSSGWISSNTFDYSIDYRYSSM